MWSTVKKKLFWKYAKVCITRALLDLYVQEWNAKFSVSSKGNLYLLFKENLNLITTAQALRSSNSYEIKKLERSVDCIWHFFILDSCTSPIKNLLYASDFFCLVWYNKPSVVYTIYQGVTGKYAFPNKMYFIPWRFNSSFLRPWRVAALFVLSSVSSLFAKVHS